MRLVRIFLMVSPWEPLIMRLRRDRALHGNTARAQISWSEYLRVSKCLPPGTSPHKSRYAKNLQHEKSQGYELAQTNRFLANQGILDVSLFLLFC
jgi:hypothetical protein